MSSAWTAIPDRGWDAAVEARGLATQCVYVALYRLGRNAIHLKETEIDGDGKMWFSVGGRLLGDRSGVAANHARKCVGNLVELGLIEARTEPRKRSWYHLKLASRSTQVRSNLRNCATTGYNESPKGDSLLVDRKKSRPKRESAPRSSGADSKRARFLDQVRAWRPSRAKPGLLVVAREESLLEEAMGAVDKTSLQSEDRLDLSAYWAFVKNSWTYREDKAGLFEEWIFRNSSEFPGYLQHLHLTKPGKSWFTELFSLLDRLEENAEQKNIEWKKDLGYVMTSRSSIERCLKIRKDWDCNLYDQSQVLRTYHFERSFTTITA